MSFTPEEQAAQLRKPHGEKAVEIMEYMNRGNQVLYPLSLEAMELKPGMRVLELGQGNGPLVHLILASGIGVTYTGIDYSPDSVRLAIEKNAAFVENGSAVFHEGLISKMPFEDGSFDCILGINVVYFWDAPKVELSEIYRVLKPGGRLVFGYRPKDKLQKLPFTNRGFVHYDPADLEKLIRETGFNSVSSNRFKEPDREIDGQRFTMDSVVTVAQKPN
jgi:SAM-dependent methyltransferase